MSDATDPRQKELESWLANSAGLNVDRLETASADASFRRYFRVYAGGAQYIAMDAPPAQEDCEPFVRIAGMLDAMQVHAPRVLASDLERGFLLLTDLGDEQYLDTLKREPDRAGSLYADALATLRRLQKAGREYQGSLPPYGVALLTRELALFRDWLCGTHLELEFTDADEQAWQTTCDWLIEASLAQPRVFVHRDYHSRNLMVCAPDNPGVLDFQDAVEGPLTYDLVSLLRDCYVRWPQKFIYGLARDFYAACRDDLPAAFDEEQFLRAFDLTGVQRQLKAAGIFARLCHRDGKQRYLDDVPRTLQYILDIAPRYRELKFLAGLIRGRCLPVLEGAA